MTSTLAKLWDWAESCDPENVTEDEAFRLFALFSFPEGCVAQLENGKCRKPAACKVNPYCLATVTPPTLYKSIRDSKKELDKLKEINEAQRQELDYVGLDNLGATCYVNSYLQMWFHTAPFRHLILSYKPPTASEADKERDDTIDATIHQLRVLFAQMLLTKKRSLLPDAFIETLGLDPSNQQDAQEFSNLWMGLLQHRFGSAFSRLFCGSCDVSIVCDACGMCSRKPDEFAELILNVPASDAMPQSQGNNNAVFENSPNRRQTNASVNLEDVLRRYFGDEVLDGDNAYDCSSKDCGKKGKAIRHTRLLKAPAILNAQVLRFAFDPVKLTRRKLRTWISFPEHLELRREYFADDSPELKQPNLPRYRIKAILCHFGTSVVRGHYTARIRLRDGWYIFNDAVVKKGDPTSGGDGGVDADENTAEACRRFKSADAYCIVYHRVDAPELRDDDDLLKDAEYIPNDLRNDVNEVEERFRSDLEKKRDEVLASSDAKETLREQRLRIRRVMAVKLPTRDDLDTVKAVDQLKELYNNQSGGDVVFAQKDWIMEYLSLKSVEDPQNAFGCGESARCAHGRLNPTEAGKLKLVTREAADLIAADLNYHSAAGQSGKALISFSPSDICLTCVRLIVFDTFYNNRAVVAGRDLKVELRLVENGNTDRDEGYWAVREVVEKFGDLAKSAVYEASEHIRGELVSRCEEPATKVKQDEAAKQFFGLDVKVEVEQKLSERNGDSEIKNGIRPAQSIVVVHQEGNKSKVLTIVRCSASDKSAEKETEYSSRVGPTPTKRAKMSSFDEGFSSDEVVRCCKIPDSPEKKCNGDLVNGSTSAESFSNGEKIERATNGELTTVASPELPQNDVVDVIRNAFQFVQRDLNNGTVCRHGSVWSSIPAPAPSTATNASNRKRAGQICGVIRISKKAWETMEEFYPHSMALSYPDFGICEECEHDASVERQKSDRIREEAKQVGVQLSSLLKRTRRNKIDAALRPVYLVTAAFCDRLADWVSGKTQEMAGNKTLRNTVGLCRHHRLPFSAEELAAEVDSDKGVWVATKSSEWKTIKDNINVDTEVFLKPIVEKLQPKDPGAAKLQFKDNSSALPARSNAGWSCTLTQQPSMQPKIGATIIQSVLNPKPKTDMLNTSSSSRLGSQSDLDHRNDTNGISIDDSSDTTETIPMDDHDDDAHVIEEISDDEDAISDDGDFADQNKGKATRGGSRGGRGRGRGRGRGKATANSESTQKQVKSKRIGWQCFPTTCQMCREERLDQLRLAEAIPEIPQWSGSVYVRFESNSAESLTPPPPASSRRRRRTPTANRKNAANAGEELDYVVSSTLPLVEFQMTILDDFEISPFEQLLYVVDEITKERRLLKSGDQATLGELNIRENQSFILKRKEEEEEEEALSIAISEVDENNKNKSKPNNRAEGFGGTLLSVLANSGPMKRPISPSAGQSN